MQHILILGAGYGGLLTALRLQPQIKNGKAKITLVNASDTFTERIRLHQVASGQIVKQYSIPTLIKGTGVNFVQDRVIIINPDKNTVVLGNDRLTYDTLVVALGSRVNRNTIDGIYEFAHTLDSRSVMALNQRLSNGGKLLVIGGGLTGIEAASEFSQREDVSVHLATRGEVGYGLSASGRNHIRSTLQNMGVTLHENVNITELHKSHADSRQGQLTYDVVLWAGGFEASPLVAEAGFSVNHAGQMLVQDTLQSVDYANVYGVGDVAGTTMQNGQTLRMACAVAMPMGAHCADNISRQLTGKTHESFGFAYALQCISLGRQDALVQLVQPDDTPKDSIVTGRKASWIKELICRYTIWSLLLEKRFPGLYSYPKSIHASQQQISALKV